MCRQIDLKVAKPKCAIRHRMRDQPRTRKQSERGRERQKELGATEAITRYCGEQLSLLKRGYAIFVQQRTKTYRVRKFDVDKNVYIIGSTPAEEVPIAETKATAVGRSAGG